MDLLVEVPIELVLDDRRTRALQLVLVEIDENGRDVIEQLVDPAKVK